MSLIFTQHCLFWKHTITESQNGWFRKGTPKVNCSNPLLKRGHLEQVVQDHIQAAFGDLHGGRLHSLSILHSSLPVFSLWEQAYDLAQSGYISVMGNYLLAASEQ